MSALTDAKRETTDQLDDAGLAAGRSELSQRTERARGEEVTGVPNFMLGPWPFGGIQTDETMLHLLGRFAAKQREGASA